MLGRVLYNVWYRPLGWSRRVARQGLARTWMANRGKAEMRRKAWHLAPCPRSTEKPWPTPIAFLTGRRFWHMTLFCAHSLQRQSTRPFLFRFIDDGTLTDEQAAHFDLVFPAGRVHRRTDLESLIDDQFPRERFPTIRRRRLEYPHLRKLTDTHLGREGPVAVMDSDMLFHREPTELLDWLDQPRQPLHLVDVESYYGYSRPLMQELAGAPIRDRVNVGITGLDGRELDWEKIERWMTAMEAREGTHYLQEQALVAMILGDAPAMALPEQRYRCSPGIQEILDPQAVMHHYVADSRLDLYIHSWRRLI